MRLHKPLLYSKKAIFARLKNRRRLPFTVSHYRMAQASIDLQEITTLQIHSDVEMSPETSHAATATEIAIVTATSPASPTHTMEATIDVGTSNGVYYGQYAPPAPLSNEELASEFVNPSIYQRKGFIIQLINNNANCSPTVIGGLRTNETDVRRIPNFLSANKTVLRQLAGRALARHLRDTQSGVAALEYLTDEDFGMSFSMASLSLRGATLNPSRRNEGPIFYCHLPGFVDPCYIGQTIDGLVDSAHVVNLYIHILPANLRRNAVIKKHRDALAKDAEAVKANMQASMQANLPANPDSTSGPAQNTSNRENGYKQGKPKSRNDPRIKPYQKPQNSNSPPHGTMGQAISKAKGKKMKAVMSDPPLPSTSRPAWANTQAPKDLPPHL